MADFVQAKETPSMITTLGYKIFFMLRRLTLTRWRRSRCGRSLEDMHIIFGSTTQEARTAHIAARETELDNEFRGDAHHDDGKVHNEQTV
jgi:hypothetical protein